MFDARIEDTMTTITIVTEEVEEAFEETEAVATGYFLYITLILFRDYNSHNDLALLNYSLF